MIKVSKPIALLVIACSMLSLSYAASASFCSHEGGPAVSSQQVYTKIDDVKHSITNIVIRICPICDNEYEIIDSLGNETHYCANMTDGGHGSGTNHYIKEMCVCSYFQLSPYTCYGPPCTTIDSPVPCIGPETWQIAASYRVTEILNQREIEDVVNTLFARKLNGLKMRMFNTDNLFTTGTAGRFDTESDQKYFSDKLEYLQALYSFTNRLPDSYAMDIELLSVKVNLANAFVEVREDVSFQYEDCDELSRERYYYQIELSKSNGNWLIHKIKSTDNFDKMYYETGFDLVTLCNEISAAKKALVSAKKNLKNAASSEIDFLSSTILNVSNDDLTFTSYDANSAAAYAASYALDYNSNFRSYKGSGGDCQNFASQCIWYGLGGFNISNNINSGSFPMVTSGTGAWHQQGPNADGSYSWINVDGFAALINGSSSLRPGPQGSYTNSEYEKCNKGDLLEYYTTNSSDYEHVYFVYRTTGIANNRTPANIFLSAHTDDIHNVSLADIWGASVSAAKFRTIKITGHYE